MTWWVETPSVLGFFGFFIWLFDNHLWKTKFVQSIEWVHIPDINGVWKAEIKSSHDTFEKNTVGSLVIRQTASKVSIALETDTSRSHSINAALLRTDKLNTFELTYNYINTPKADSSSKMQMHQGTAWLTISDDLNILDGEYYSGRGRQNFGKLILRRK